MLCQVPPVQSFWMSLLHSHPLSAYQYCWPVRLPESSDLILESPKPPICKWSRTKKTSQLFFFEGLMEKSKRDNFNFQREWNTSEPTIDFQASMLVLRDVYFFCFEMSWKFLGPKFWPSTWGDKSKSPKICRWRSSKPSPEKGCFEIFHYLEMSFRKWCLDQKIIPNSILDTVTLSLVGGWTNPNWKICSSNWNHFPK